MASFCVAILLLCGSLPVSAQVLTGLREKKTGHKDDVILLANGDRLTGEIKKVEFGILYLKSDLATDTLKLDWKNVVSVQSKARYEFEMRAGDRYIGVILSQPEDQSATGEVDIRKDDGSSIRLNIREILGVRELQRSILGRLNLTLDAGISFTQGNKQTQTTVQSSLAFLKPKYSFKMDASSLFSGTSGTTDTSRHELSMAADRVLSVDWNFVFLSALLHDNQQQLALRATAGGGLRRMFIKSNRVLLSAVGGFAYTNENYFPEAGSDRNNAEILTSVNFTTYHFRGSELQILIQVFPSLSDIGRVRVDAYSYWKWEIVKDLYWKFSLLNNYDSRPPDPGSKNNLSFTSSVGWSF